MKTGAALVMLINAAFFFFGAIQHAGVAVGHFHEPVIIPAAIVESLCGVSLLWGGTALLRSSKPSWRVAWIANGIALAGVVLGMIALALGAGPRTTSNDRYHLVMVILITAALFLLLLSRRRSDRRLT